jgi:hypothetical protein
MNFSAKKTGFHFDNKVNATEFIEGGTSLSSKYGAKSTATSFTVVTQTRINDIGTDYILEEKTRTITINSDGSISVGAESGWTSKGTMSK